MSFQLVREHTDWHIFPCCMVEGFFEEQLVWTLTVEKFKYGKFNREY